MTEPQPIAERQRIERLFDRATTPGERVAAAGAAIAVGVDMDSGEATVFPVREQAARLPILRSDDE